MTHQLSKRAEKILAEGAADLVAMGRAFIADPELISKTLHDNEDSVAECVNCRYCFQTIMDDGGNGMSSDFVLMFTTGDTTGGSAFDSNGGFEDGATGVAISGDGAILTGAQGDVSPACRRFP